MQRIAAEALMPKTTGAFSRAMADGNVDYLAGGPLDSPEWICSGSVICGPRDLFNVGGYAQGIIGGHRREPWGS